MLSRWLAGKFYSPQALAISKYTAVLGFGGKFMLKVGYSDRLGFLNAVYLRELSDVSNKNLSRASLKMTNTPWGKNIKRRRTSFDK